MGLRATHGARAESARSSGISSLSSRFWVWEDRLGAYIGQGAGYRSGLGTRLWQHQEAHVKEIPVWKPTFKNLERLESFKACFLKAVKIFAPLPIPLWQLPRELCGTSVAQRWFNSSFLFGYEKAKQRKRQDSTLLLLDLYFS